MSKRVPAVQPQPKKSHARRTSPRKETPSARGGSGKGGRQRLPAPALPAMRFEFDDVVTATVGRRELTTNETVKVPLANGDSFYVSPEKIRKG